MSDIAASNLEPIDEKDLDLGSKFGNPEASKNIEGVEKSADFPVPAEVTENKTEKESAKEVISAEKENAYNKILARLQAKKQTVAKDDDVSKDAKDVSKKQDAEGQIQHLVDLAMNKGVIYAVKVAKHLEDNYVLDMFHDRMLAEELHDALVKKGLIKEV
ncbi:MAG: hypothetical protein Q7S18_00560 [bacterium]|nr:hypothetical protein [bacterium]